MKKETVLLAVLFVVMAVLPETAYSRAAVSEGGEKTLSPYFHVKSDNPELDKLPLKSTSVKVNIAGVMAHVFVTQVYQNRGSRPIEAVYVFPASTKAAVHGMKMTLGERTITADIRERDKARREYERAKKAGKTASLLEQQRPNVFQMNVANILPGDEIKVELTYTELLVAENALYEFVYPTVVGPRYTEKKARGAGPEDVWTENPYLRSGTPPAYGFDLEVRLEAGLPLQEIQCGTHKTDIDYLDAESALIKLDASEKSGGDRDFILRYRLSGGTINTGLLLSRGGDENFFLAMVQPPRRFRKEMIPPREYIFIVDVSGSMNGFPLDISKRLLRDLIGRLRPSDKFNVLLFAGRSSVMSETSVPANAENIQRAIHVIENSRGGGGTRLLPALKRALSMPGAGGHSRTLIIATDGYVSVESEAFEIIRENLGEANMFAFGIGSSVNRYLIEGMARAGMGEPFIVTRPEEAPRKAEAFREMIAHPLLTDIEVQFKGFEAYDVEPRSIPDLLADRPLLIFGKWRGRPGGTIRLQGVSGAGRFSSILHVAGAKSLEKGEGLSYLWARHRIAMLSDDIRLAKDDGKVKEVTRLGLKYHLLTAYTSFVAVDKQVRVKDGRCVTVKQPLPLPRGVSDLAVGNMPAALTRAKGMGAPAAGFRGGQMRTFESAQREAPAEEDRAGKKAQALSVGIKKISASGVSVSTARKSLERVMHEVTACWRNSGGPAFGDGQEIAFVIKLDSRGRVSDILQEKGRTKIEEGLMTCLSEVLGEVSFPGVHGKAGAIIKVVLAVSGSDT